MSATPPPDDKQFPASKIPFGYCRRGATLIPDETESVARKLMYELFLTHRRKKTVARLLNDAGHRTRSGALFSDTTIDRLLRDESATGIIRLAAKGSKQREIKIEPLVAIEVWRQIQEILNDEKKPLKKAAHLFAGIVFCECGGKMNVPSNSPKYVCESCRRKIETADLDDIFASQLRAFPLAAFAADAADTSETLADYWHNFETDEQRIIVEQIASRIEIGTRDISIEFCISPNSLETMTFGQQQTESALEPHSEPDGQNDPKAASDDKVVPPTASPQTPPMSLTEPLLNETDAAKFLGISRMTLLRKRNAGEIKFFRVGYRILYSKEKHLVPFLEKCETETRQE